MPPGNSADVRAYDHIQTSTDRMSRLAGLPEWLSHSLAAFAGARTYQAAYGPLREPP